MAVVGPLAMQPEPHTYDLCQGHAHNLTAPRGWELVRHDGDFTPGSAPPDDLAALAEAVQEASPPRPDPPAEAGPATGGHLRLVPPA